MKKYDLVKRTAEIKYKDRKEIEEGCTAFDDSPEYIKTFDTLEEAKKELAKRKTDVSKFSCHGMTFYKVEEYVIEENEFEYDEDESKFVQMKIEVVEIPSHETIAICSSLEEAEEAEDNYEGENETCIMI